MLQKHADFMGTVRGKQKAPERSNNFVNGKVIFYINIDKYESKEFYCDI